MPEELTIEEVPDAFEDLKRALLQGAWEEAAAHIGGEAEAGGQQLIKLCRSADADALTEADALSRLFILLARGAEEPLDTGAWRPATVFIMAMQAFPYADQLIQRTGLGDYIGVDGDDNPVFQRLEDGEFRNRSFRLIQEDGTWKFDLMPLYVDMATAVEAFVQEEFAGDFSAFVNRFAEDHGITLDFDRAWQPLAH